MGCTLTSCPSQGCPEAHSSILYNTAAEQALLLLYFIQGKRENLTFAQNHPARAWRHWDALRRADPRTNCECSCTLGSTSSSFSATAVDTHSATHACETVKWRHSLLKLREMAQKWEEKTQDMGTEGSLWWQCSVVTSYSEKDIKETGSLRASSSFTCFLLILFCRC